MKKLLLILVFLSPLWVAPLWGGGCFAQGDFTRIYHPIINEAELAIVDTNYYEALDFYKEAFANVKKPFAKDYYNAAICAAMAGKLPLTLEYLEKIVEKGYPADSLRKDVFFHYVADTCKRWSTFEKQMKLVKPNINRELRDSLNKLYALSTKEIYTPLTPELRKFYKETFKYKPDSTKKETVAYRIIFPTDSLIFNTQMPKNIKQQYDSLQKINDKIYSKNNEIAFQKTMQFVENDGFPDENIIGLSGNDTKRVSKFGNIYTYYQDYHEFVFVKSLTSSLLTNTFASSDKEMLPFIIQAIREGKVQPDQINHIIPLRFNKITKAMDGLPIAYSMGKVQVIQLQLESNLTCENAKEIGNKKFWKKEKLGEYSEVEINEKRQDIGLEKLKDAYKKAFFKANRTPFIINGGFYQKEVSYISSCEVLEKIMKESVPVK